MIVKCAECGILGHIPELIGCEDSEIRILPTSRFVIEKRIKPAAEVLQSALEFCREHDAVPELQSEENFDQIREERIDDGEALLYSLAIDIDANIFSGDKRAIMAIQRKRSKISAIVSQLGGRVICFEEFLLRFHDEFGFEELRDACIRSKDKMLMQCFSNGSLTDEEDAMFGIWSNYRHLVKNSGNLLIPRVMPENDVPE